MIPTPIIQKLTPFELDKIDSDLNFIRNFLKFAHTHKLRTIVSGGYAIDSYFNTITRPHNDIDLVIYSNQKREFVIQDVF